MGGVGIEVRDVENVSGVLRNGKTAGKRQRCKRVLGTRRRGSKASNT